MTCMGFVVVVVRRTWVVIAAFALVVALGTGLVVVVGGLMSLLQS